MYSSTALSLRSVFSIVCYFILTLHYILEGNVEFLFHYFYLITLVSTYFADTSSTFSSLPSILLIGFKKH